MTFFKDKRVAWSIFLFAFIFAIIIGQLRKAPYVERDNAIKIERELKLEQERAAKEAETAISTEALSGLTELFSGEEDHVRGLSNSTKLFLVIILIVFLSKAARKK